MNFISHVNFPLVSLAVDSPLFLPPFKVFLGLPFWITDTTILIPNFREVTTAIKVKSRPLGMVFLAPLEPPQVMTHLWLFCSGQAKPLKVSRAQHILLALHDFDHTLLAFHKIFFPFYTTYNVYISFPIDLRWFSNQIYLEIYWKILPIAKEPKWFIWFYHIFCYQVFIKYYAIKE